MKVYEIWMEGFCITGGRAQASYVGSMEGESFEDAVKKWYAAHPERSFNFNPETLTDWGCGLFPDEASARRSFG